MKQYRILYSLDNQIIDNGTRYDTLANLQGDFPDSNYAIIPVGDVPENWEQMTVVNGVLVLASAEILAERAVVRGIAATEAVRQARAALYTTTTDPLMFDAIEAFALAHPEDIAFTAWLDAKAAIRTQHPKTETH